MKLSLLHTACALLGVCFLAAPALAQLEEVAPVRPFNITGWGGEVYVEGTYRDEQLMKRIFAMLAIVFVVIGVSMYLPHYKVVAFLNLLMMTGGLWSTTGYLREVDSAPR